MISKSATKTASVLLDVNLIFKVRNQPKRFHIYEITLLVLKQRKSRLYFGAKLLLGSLALILVESLPLNRCEFPSKKCPHHGFKACVAGQY